MACPVARRGDRSPRRNRPRPPVFWFLRGAQRAHL